MSSKQVLNTLMHLYVDTYLSSRPLREGNEDVKRTNRVLNDLRSASNSYKPKTKEEVFKFTLLSYSLLRWESVCINYETETNQYDELNKYISSIFPNCSLTNRRASSAYQFYDKLKRYDDESWIFFAVNNDHPYVCDRIVDLDLYTRKASRYQAYGNTSVLYSHHQEALLSLRFGDRLFGYNRLNTKYLGEDRDAFFVKYHRLILDSIHIYNAKQLKKMFENESISTKKIVRPEDLDAYLTLGEHVVIVPKIELCRHFDGYLHTEHLCNNYISFSECPPMLIPDGFFTENYSITFKANASHATVTSCGLAKKYHFDSNDGVDLKYCPDQLPLIYRRNAASLSNGCGLGCANFIKYVDRKYYSLSFFRFIRNIIFDFLKRCKYGFK